MGAEPTEAAWTRNPPESVEGAADTLVDLSHRMHANPELCFEEEKSSAWVAAALSDGGFEVDKGVCDLPTAFVATAGSGPLTIAICAEYDALPGIGHACGHNVIASARSAPASRWRRWPTISASPSR